MASSMLVKVTCFAMICLVLGIPLADAALPCWQVKLTVVSCVAYLRKPGPSVPAPCCNGIKSLNSKAITTPDRQSVCRCLKSTVLNLPGVNLPAAATLPTNCGVNLPYNISPSIDCDTVK